MAKPKVKEVGKLDIDAVLGSASKPEKTKKSAIPVLEVSSTVEKDVDKIRELKEQIDSLQTVLDMKFAELLGVVKKDREEICKREYVSSVKVPGSVDETITIVWKHAYSKVELERETELKQIVGARYGEYFARKAKIEIKEGISDEALMELIQAIGIDKFREHFDVERWIAPLQRYTTEYYNVFSAEEREKLEEIVRQYKPSLKTK